MGKVEELVKILRNITLVVRMMPFVYTALYIPVLATYTFIDSNVLLDVIDYLVFVSPMVVIVHLIYSRMLKLCKWHRMACAIPLIPQAVALVDNYWLHLSYGLTLLIMIAIGISVILFAFCIYKVFFTDEGKVC